MENVTKYCSGCSQIKDITDFGIDNSEKDGYRYQCKVCRNAKQREYARNNKDLIKERNAKGAKARKAYYQSDAGIESSRRAHLKRVYGLIDQVSWEKEKLGHLQTIFKDGKFFNKTTLTKIRKLLKT